MSTETIGKPVGIVGNDEYGPAIARRLAASGRRTIYAALAGSPVVTLSPRLERAATPTDIAFECEIVLAAIDDTEILRTLLLGDADRMGLGGEMQPGSVLVDVGARTPRELQAFLGLLGARGIAVVDATLLGGVDAIANGRARALVGGYPDAADQASAVLTMLGTIERTGPLGSAHAAAALMGYIEAAHTIAREEALALGRACGLAEATLDRVLSDDSPSTGMNVVELKRHAALARRIARDRGLSADIIDLASEKRSRRRSENS